MIEFARLWAFALAPLPLLAWWLLPARPARAALRLPGSVWQVLSEVAGGRSADRRAVPRGLALCAVGWLALVAALAGPRVPDAPLIAPTGRDVMIALDLSASMAEPLDADGTAVRRIDTVRDLLGGFLAGRRGDRVGLIGFADAAYLIAPLSFDTRAVAGLLAELSIGLPGRRTDLGRAIGLAVRALRDEPAGERLLIVLSDGEVNAGDLSALDAASLAAAHGITVHMIGFAEDAAGDAVRHMREVAARTGGRYFTAPAPEALRAIYAEIDRMAPVAAPTDTARPVDDWSWLPMLVALAAVTALGWRELRGT